LLRSTIDSCSRCPTPGRCTARRKLSMQLARHGIRIDDAVLDDLERALALA